ncbi:DUF2500 domain-containing protein [Fictibacillus fluitans]|uniref:DUF2500 domain-containing protein n=1 Tax=Fictibacillus fluitans TaxID=3058422 RepID=A0ABT8HW46_9BACL|nr:DUF2500 domain-containing protein [Fictibacillus sp. NE201]MDN4524997.1 DUF2500 domain-containing protein [Fictibacillus sp. NE201]
MLDDPFGVGAFPFLIGAVTIFIIAAIVVSVIIDTAKGNKNNQSPPEKAMVVTKRTAVHGGGESRAYNRYYVTFQLENGERLEFKVSGEEFGMLVEGDAR